MKPVLKNSEIVDFNAFAAVITSLGAEKSPAMMHGILTALSLYEDKDLIESALMDALPEQNNRTIFEEYIQTIHASVASDEFSFQLLLPEDDSPLTERLTALSDWCYGFLDGLGVQPMNLQSTEVKEVLQDLENIAHIDSQSGEYGSEAEADYAELTEFVRMAIMLLANELLYKTKER